MTESDKLVLISYIPIHFYSEENPKLPLGFASNYFTKCFFLWNITFYASNMTDISSRKLLKTRSVFEFHDKKSYLVTNL